jgi:hypothetical protein
MLSKCTFRSAISDLSFGCLTLIYKREFRKLIEDTVYEVDCALVTVKPGADVDIGTVDSQDGYQDLPLILDRC